MKKGLFFLNTSSYSRSYMKIPVRPSYGGATSQSEKKLINFLGEWDVYNTIQSLSQNSGHTQEGEMYEESLG